MNTAHMRIHASSMLQQTCAGIGLDHEPKWLVVRLQLLYDMVEHAVLIRWGDVRTTGLHEFDAFLQQSFHLCVAKAPGHAGLVGSWLAIESCVIHHAGFATLCTNMIQYYHSAALKIEATS